MRQKLLIGSSPPAGVKARSVARDPGDRWVHTRAGEGFTTGFLGWFVEVLSAMGVAVTVWRLVRVHVLEPLEGLENAQAARQDRRLQTQAHSLEREALDRHSVAQTRWRVRASNFGLEESG